MTIAFIVALAIYMVSFVLMTEVLKPIVRRVFRLKEDIKGGKALLLAWMVGLLLYWPLFFFGKFAIRWESVFIFIALTGLATGAYNWDGVKRAIAFLLSGVASGERK